MSNSTALSRKNPLTPVARMYNRLLELMPARLAKAGAQRLRCERGVTIKTPTRLSLGRGVTFQRRSLVHCGGKWWCDYDGAISLGNHVVIGPNCVLYGAGGISIGDYTHLGPGAMVITQSGVVDDDSRYSTTPARIHEPVVIGKGVWIGAGAVVVGGSKLGDGCTVGPNSVVSGEYGPGSTLIGNPARVARVHGVA